MKKNKKISICLFLSFILFLVASYFTRNKVSDVFTSIAYIVLLLYLIYDVFLNIKYNKKIYIILLSILKTIIYIFLLYLLIRKMNTINVDEAWKLSRYIDRVGMLFTVTFLVDLIIDKEKRLNG